MENGFLKSLVHSKNGLIEYFKDEILNKIDYGSCAIWLVQIEKLTFDKAETLIENPEKSLLFKALVELKTKDFINYLHQASENNLANSMSSIGDKFKKEVKNHKFTTFKKRHGYLFSKNNSEILAKSDTSHQQLLDYSPGNKPNKTLSKRELLGSIEIAPSVINQYLIKGDSGIGKTFHFVSILLDWAEGNDILQKFTLLHLELDKIKSSNLIDEIFKQNFSKNTIVTKPLLEYFLSNKDDSVKILLLIDGAEELRVNKGEIYSIVCEKFDLPFQMIVWSRVEKAKEIENLFTHRYQLLGLNETQINNIFVSCFSRNSGAENNYAEDLMKLIKSDDDLKKICEIPLFVLIIARVWPKKDVRKSRKYLVIQISIQVLFEQKNHDQNSIENYLNYLKTSAYDSFINNTLIKEVDIIKETQGFDGLLQSCDSSMGSGYQWKFFHTIYLEYFVAQYVIDNWSEINDQFLTDFNAIENKFILRSVFEFIKEGNTEIFLSIISQMTDTKFLEEDIPKDLLDILKQKNLKNLELSLSYFPKRIIQPWLASQRFIKRIKLHNVLFEFDVFVNGIIANPQPLLTDLFISVIDNPEQHIRGLQRLVCDLKYLKKLSLINVSFSSGKCDIYSKSLLEITLENCYLQKIDKSDGICFNCSNLQKINLSKNTFSSIIFVFFFKIFFCPKSNLSSFFFYRM